MPDTTGKVMEICLSVLTYKMLKDLARTGLYSRSESCLACAESEGRCDACDGMEFIYANNPVIVVEEIIRNHLRDLVAGGAFATMTVTSRHAAPPPQGGIAAGARRP